MYCSSNINRLRSINHPLRTKKVARAAVLWAEDGASTLLMWLKIKVSVLSGLAGKGEEVI